MATKKQTKAKTWPNDPASEIVVLEANLKLLRREMSQLRKCAVNSDALLNEVKRSIRRQDDLSVRIGRVEVDGLEAQRKRRYDEVQEALGGAIWKDIRGCRRYVGLLSTTHLRNILAYTRTSCGTADLEANLKLLRAVRKEIDRREVDAEYREDEWQRMSWRERIAQALRILRGVQP